MATIEQRTPTSWLVYWNMSRNLGGRRQKTTWESRELADKAAAYAKAMKHNVTALEVKAQICGVDLEEFTSTTPTLAEYVPTWLEGHGRYLEPSTRQGYEGQMNNHILKVLGDVRLDEIKVAHIDKLKVYLREQGFSKATTIRYLTCLSSCLKFAITRQAITGENVVSQAGYRVPAGVDKPARAMDAERRMTYAEYQLILGHIPPKWRPFVELMAHTGARPQEAMTVQGGDFDLDEGTLHIQRAWKRDKDKPHGGYVGPPKTKDSLRLIALGVTIQNVMRPVLEGCRPDEFVWRSPLGTNRPFDYDNFRARVWEVAVAKAMRCAEHPPPLPTRRRAGPPRQWRKDEVSTCGCTTRLNYRFTLQSLRHAHATWLLAKGASIYDVAKRLGHSDTKMVEQRYGRYTLTRDKQVATLTDML